MGECIYRDAEQQAADYLTALGYRNVRVTRPAHDSGIDVVADGLVAQVKAGAHLAGRPCLQQLVGAANADRDVVLAFFSMAGFASTAAVYATQHSIALFASLTPANDEAEQVASGQAIPTRPTAGQLEADRIDRIVELRVQAELNRRAVAPAEYLERSAVTSALWARLQEIETDVRNRARDGAPCPCGLPFRRLEQVVGRSEALLLMPGSAGRLVRVQPNVWHQGLQQPGLESLAVHGWHGRPTTGSRSGSSTLVGLWTSPTSRLVPGSG